MTALAALFQTGEVILLHLDFEDGTAAEVDSISSKAKQAGPGLSIPASTEPVAFTFTVNERAAAGSVPAGYDLIYTGADVPAGIYCANFAVIVDALPFKSRHIFFKVEDSVT